MSFFSMSLLLFYSIDEAKLMAKSILGRVEQYDEEQAWLRQFVIPEEQRHRFTSMPWRGGDATF